MDGSMTCSTKSCESWNCGTQRVYLPCEESEMEGYETHDVLYQLPLAPCKVETISKPGSDKIFVKKTVFKDGLNDSRKVAVRQECVIHSELDHPNIVKLHKYYESEDNLELVMDYCSKGSYFEDRLEDHYEPIEDMDALKKYAKEALQGLAHIHSKGIIHCDVKLSNMGLNKNAENSEEILQIFDFNLSVFADSDLEGKAHLDQCVGTFGYMAPELKGSDIYVGPEIDMWALGICLYKMCVAYAPDKVRKYKYGSGPIPFLKRDWKNIDPEFQELIKLMLEYDPESRISSSEALKHQALN